MIASAVGAKRLPLTTVSRAGLITDERYIAAVFQSVQYSTLYTRACIPVGLLTPSRYIHRPTYILHAANHGRKPPVTKKLDSFSSFDKTPTYDRREGTVRHRAMISYIT